MDQETNDTHSVDNEFKSATEVLDDYIDCWFFFHSIFSLEKKKFFFTDQLTQNKFIFPCFS
jgi:hypothetical protein